MDTWKILIISLLAAVAIGSVGGSLIGKILVKRARSGRKSLLTKKERIAYLFCILLGTASILVGVFYKFPDNQAAVQDGISLSGSEVPGPGEADVVVVETKV